MRRLGIGAGFCLLTSAALLAAETLSFQLLRYKSGPEPERFGQAVTGVGDLDGDGAADFLVGSPRANPNGESEAGSAYVYSGGADTLICKIDGEAAGERLGTAVGGLGDVDGDGIPDLIIGSPYAAPGGKLEAGKAGIYSGRSGNRLYEIFGSASFDHLGTSVAGVGDLNGDGRGDFVAGAPQADPDGHGNAGSAYVYSGADDSLLFQVDGRLLSDFLGSAVAGAGDVNGDGKLDLLIGAPFADTGMDARVNAGAALVISGLDGGLIFAIRGDSADEFMGFSVAGAGDVNGDGRADILVGAPNSSDPWDGGRVDLYSGADHTLLNHFSGGQAAGLFGWAVASAGDANSDGRPDILIGAISVQNDTLPYAGSAYLYSGTDGSLLFQINGQGAFDEMGYSLAGLGDVNGDGQTDFIVSALAADSGKGAVSVYGLVPTDAPEIKNDRPLQFRLSQNYPNPFNAVTTIQYSTPKREKVALEVFNLNGQRVRVLANEEQPAGEHRAVWDGKDERGKTLPSGIYFYRLKGRSFGETKKMILLK